MSFKQECYIALQICNGDFYAAAERMNLTPAELTMVFKPKKELTTPAYDVNHKTVTSGTVHPDVWAK